MNIRTALTSIKGNFTKYLAKGTGIAALGIVAYDSHIVGKLQSDVYSKSRDAKATPVHCLTHWHNTGKPPTTCILQPTFRIFYRGSGPRY